MADLTGAYDPTRPRRRAADTCPAPADLADDVGWAAHLLDATRAAWLRGAIPDRARFAVQIAERAALAARLTAALAAAGLDPARSGWKGAP